MNPVPKPSLEVQQFLRSVPRDRRPLVMELRSFVLDAAPETTETVLWKGLSYHKAFEGGRVRGAVCQISPRDECVRLGFMHGASLPDPGGLLRGTARAKRYVPVRSFTSLPRAALRELIRQAVAHRPDSRTARRDAGTL